VWDRQCGSQAGATGEAQNNNEEQMYGEQRVPQGSERYLRIWSLLPDWRAARDAQPAPIPPCLEQQLFNKDASPHRRQNPCSSQQTDGYSSSHVERLWPPPSLLWSIAFALQNAVLPFLIPTC